MAKDLEFFDAPINDPKIWDHNKQYTDGKGGGYFAASSGITAGTTVKLGTPIYFDLSTHIVHVVKNALVITGGTTTAPRVSKKNLLSVGEFVYVSGDAVAINSIDKTNAAYDTLTLSAPCVGATAGAYLEQATAAGATPALKYAVNALLGEAVKNVQGGERVMPVMWVFELINSAKLPYDVSPATVAALVSNGFKII